MLKTVMKSSGRILACVAVVALLTGMGCINSLMFHPDFCRGGYGESTEGYVDIGTNGVKIAAIVLGLYGVMLLICFIIWHLCTIESFGVAYTSPFTDGGFGNTLRAMLRPPIRKDKYRPRELKGEDKRNQK